MKFKRDDVIKECYKKRNSRRGGEMLKDENWDSLEAVSRVVVSNGSLRKTQLCLKLRNGLLSF